MVGVITEDGEDVTDAYRAGAEAALKIAREHSCTVAVLKARSPSCGCGEIYDGSFTHTIKAGWGRHGPSVGRGGLRVMTRKI